MDNSSTALKKLKLFIPYIDFFCYANIEGICTHFLCAHPNIEENITGKSLIEILGQELGKTVIQQLKDTILISRIAVITKEYTLTSIPSDVLYYQVKTLYTNELTCFISITQLEIPYYPNISKIIKDKKFKKIFDNNLIPMAIVNHQEVFVEVNSALCEISGYSFVELTNMKISDIYAPESKLLSSSELDNFRQSEQNTIQLDRVLMTKNNERRYVRVSVQPLYTDNGKHEYDLGIFQDVTDTQHALDKLRQREKELEEKINEIILKNEQLRKYISSNMQLESFAYMVAHDLKQPLRGMKFFAQLLEKEIKQYDGISPETNKHIQFIINDATTLNQLVNDLLNYSLITRTNTPENTFKNININHVLVIVKQNLAQQIAESKANIITQDLPTDILAINFKIIQLFQNLIANAIKFRRRDVPLTIHITGIDTPSYWQFDIADNGIGIDMTYAEKIFDMFKKLHTNVEYEGSGIGLATCKAVVEQHGGAIWVAGELGQGSTFHFTIPKNPIMFSALLD